MFHDLMNKEHVDLGIVATNKKKSFHHEAGDPSVAPSNPVDTEKEGFFASPKLCEMYEY